MIAPGLLAGLGLPKLVELVNLRLVVDSSNEPRAVALEFEGDRFVEVEPEP